MMLFYSGVHWDSDTELHHFSTCVEKVSQRAVRRCGWLV